MTQANTQTQAIEPKKSTGSSKIGAVLSVLSLIIATIGSALVHYKWKATEPVTSTSEKVGEAVGSGTGHVLATIFSIPFLVGAIGFALLAIVLTAVKLRKVRVGGFVTSAVWILLSIWAIKIATAAFQVIKAHPAS